MSAKSLAFGDQRARLSGGRLKAIWRFLTRGDSFYSNAAIRSYFNSLLPPEQVHFLWLALPLYVVATDLKDKPVYIFGEDPDDLLLDALLASTAVPPLFPPVSYRDHLLADGALAANVPLSIAIAKGATEIYSLEISPKRLWSCPDSTDTKFVQRNKLRIGGRT